MISPEEYLLERINQERALRGKKPLSPDRNLTNLALQKSMDMLKNNYFSHFSPTYGKTSDMLRKNKVQYSLAGENLAKAMSISSAFNLFMKSPVHRANILLSNYDSVGIGIVPQKSGSGVIVTIIFSSPRVPLRQ